MDNSVKTEVVDNGNGTVTITTTNTITNKRTVNAAAYKKSLEAKQTKVTEALAAQTTEIADQLAIVNSAVKIASAESASAEDEAKK